MNDQNKAIISSINSIVNHISFTLKYSGVQLAYVIFVIKKIINKFSAK